MQHMKYTIETHNTKLSIYIVPFYGLDEINNAVLPFLKKILVYNVVGLSYTVLGYLSGPTLPLLVFYLRRISMYFLKPLYKINVSYNYLHLLM